MSEDGLVWIEGEWDRDRTGYDRMLDLPRCGWGWEYARRAPNLKTAAQRVRRHHPIITHRSKTNGQTSNLIRLRRRCLAAEEFGLHFFPDPELSAFETTPFWLPEVMSGSLDAALEFENQMQRNGKPLRLRDLPGERHYLIGPGRRPKLIIAAKGYAAQLAIANDALAIPQAVYLSLRLGAGQLVGKNLGPVEEFAEFCRGGLPWKPMRGLSPEKLRDAIIALDGTLAGVSRRRIAGAVFDEKLVATEWDSGDDLYKKRTKRLVEKGLAMMDYGYRNLL